MNGLPDNRRLIAHIGPCSCETRKVFERLGLLQLAIATTKMSFWSWPERTAFGNDRGGKRQ